MHRAAFLVLVPALMASGAPIDREALITRHNPVIRHVTYDAPLTVGNGGFAFTVDVTGLQSFGEDYYHNGIPLETLARWCWVTDPNPRGYALDDTNEDYRRDDGSGRAFPTRLGTPASDWLRQNPRLYPLGRVALEWRKDRGAAFVPADVETPEQTLDLWRGIVTSRYRLGGVPVKVVTACDPASDTIAVRIESDLVASGKLRVRLAFPRGHDLAVKNTPDLDWSHPEAHVSRLVQPGTVEREVSGTRYFAVCDRPLRPGGAHEFFLEPDQGRRELPFTLQFSPGEETRAPTVNQVLARSAAHWEKFWRTGAVADFSGSTNSRAAKIEERIVLSQYLTAVQCASDVPPQESGLTCNTWFGKHHTEMIWWSQAHFILEGHDALAEKGLDWFRAHLPEAHSLAQSRQLRGARWAKMVGPGDRESPGGNSLIIWNQPHPIYLAELLYRNSPDRAILSKYRELVLDTAECMASMVQFDAKRGEYALGPPLWIAEEVYDPATSRNPSFELAYWRWALGVAQAWRERLGLRRDEHWDDVISRLAPLPVRDGKYVALESHPDTWDNPASRHDHPEMLMSLGFLPEGPEVDRATMQRTLDAVLAQWDWKTKIWGWDYPMMAMTATRLGRPKEAVDVLMRDGLNNRYTASGLCPQGSDQAQADQTAGRREIAAYLPANGAFLSAMALMIAGWDGCAERYPGFPKDGTWKIRAEGWHPLP
ncbi:MAG TPA: hypothetical protein VG710_13960 [Opitutus sp.]|nr:hypothetical protein [Opitutus sp.]